MGMKFTMTVRLDTPSTSTTKDLVDVLDTLAKRLTRDVGQRDFNTNTLSVEASIYRGGVVGSYLITNE